MIEEKIYKHSGESNLMGFLLALGLGILLAVFSGFIYNLLIIVIPIIYVNLLLTIGFGAALGYGNKFFSRFGKIRNKSHLLILAGMIGFVGFVFQWIAYFVFLISGKFSFQAYQNNFDLFYNPLNLFDMVLELNKVGSWAMFGITFTGFPLWFIWALEALLIIGIPILITYKHPIIPFSENLNKWYPKYIVKNQFSHISAQNQFRKNLIENVLETINNLSYGDAFRYSKVSIFYLKNEQLHYLSIDNIFVENKGKGKQSKTSVIHLLKIDTAIAHSIMDKFKVKKQFLFDY